MARMDASTKVHEWKRAADMVSVDSSRSKRCMTWSHSVGDRLQARVTSLDTRWRSAERDTRRS